MDQDVGAGVALSFLVVGLVAVAFYRPDPPVARPPSERTAEAIVIPKSGPPAPLPRPTPGVPLAEATSPPLAPPAMPRSVQVAPPRSIRPASHRPAVRRPSSAFASVAEGEALADIARRVYGTEEAVETLWQANRDQIDHLDTPIRAGMLLRTP